MASKPLMIVGGALMAFAVLVPSLMFATAEDGWGTLSAVFFMFIVGFPLGITGLILLIVGAVRGRGQQQQQQVVVVAGPPPAHLGGAGGMACRACRKPLAFGARFCNACGQRA